MEFKERVKVWGGVVAAAIPVTIMAREFWGSTIAQYVTKNSEQITSAWGQNGMNIASSLDELVGVGIVIGCIAGTAYVGAFAEGEIVPVLKKYRAKWWPDRGEIMEEFFEEASEALSIPTGYEGTTDAPAP